ncbi:MAG: hypothetical protein FWG20_07175, partial [Candidatus Cloacimonetes bacterium]|nr:hypothetical protein [Candidatus Cloacimonadota bacterium]
SVSNRSGKKPYTPPTPEKRALPRHNPVKPLPSKNASGYEVKPENMLPLDSFDDGDFDDFK